MITLTQIKKLKAIFNANRCIKYRILMLGDVKVVKKIRSVFFILI